MDIASLSISMANYNLRNDISISMIKKSLDSIEVEGNQIVKLLDSISSIDSKSLIDISI